VMEEANDEPDDGTLTTEAKILRLRALMPHDEACERQCDVQSVLTVVVDRVDAEIARDFASEQLFEMRECFFDRSELKFGPGRPIKCFDSLKYRRRGAHLDGIGDVKITAPDAFHYGCCRGSTAVPLRVDLQSQESRQ